MPIIDPAGVAQQYVSDSLLDRIDEALAQAGLDTGRLDWCDLAPFDHFHSRGVAATTELAQALTPEPGTHVQDLGCGVAGPARPLTATCHCRVTGVDLAPTAIEAATALSARTGLSDRTQFREADALALPFPDATFDPQWTQHAAMNIADRAQLYAEIRRVLKPGAAGDPRRDRRIERPAPVPGAVGGHTRKQCPADTRGDALRADRGGVRDRPVGGQDGGHTRGPAIAAGCDRGLGSPAATAVRAGVSGVPAHGPDFLVQPA